MEKLVPKRVVNESAKHMGVYSLVRVGALLGENMPASRSGENQAHAQMCAGTVHGEHRLLMNHLCALLALAGVYMALLCSCTSRNVKVFSDTLVSST